MIEMSSNGEYSENEFFEHESTVEKLKKEIKADLEKAKNEGNLIMDTVAYPTS